jgi:hypothetical protein
MLVSFQGFLDNSPKDVHTHQGRCPNDYGYPGHYNRHNCVDHIILSSILLHREQVRR